MQDRAAHFERVFGADGAGLRCEALVNSAKAAMARAVSLAATPGVEHEHLRRGRGRWHRSRLYHAMRQVRGFSTGVWLKYGSALDHVAWMGNRCAVMGSAKGIGRPCPGSPNTGEDIRHLLGASANFLWDA